jgi:hypothetical protein
MLQYNSPDSSENPFIVFLLNNKRLQRIAGIAPEDINYKWRKVY